MIRLSHEPQEPVIDPGPRRALIGIHLLPSAATLGNLLCGFLAIYCCALSIRAAYFAGTPARLASPHLLALFAPTWVAAGAVLVVLAMLFDALDGRLARIARRTTEFGAQLDSIADIVSFGAAPPLLFLTTLLPMAVPGEGDALLSKLQWRLSLVGALVYVSCAAIRLARYNAENIRSESGQKSFSGLPVPGAAAAFLALLVVHEALMSSGPVAGGVDWAAVVRWLTAPAAFGLGLLMVSRLGYVHVFNVYLRRKQPPIHLIWLVVAAVIGWFSPEVLLLVGAAAYVLSGIVLGRRRRTPASAGATGGSADRPPNVN